MRRNHRMVCGGLVLAFVFAGAQPAVARDAGERARLSQKKCKASDFESITDLSATITGNADGDTPRVRVGKDEYSVRMLSMDTPEKNYQSQNQGYWAFRASERLAELLPPGTAVRLVFEEEKCDRYGRMLAHVYRGKTNINLRMVSEGYAVNYCIFPNIRFCEAYGRAAQRNLERGVNYYGAEEFIEPYEWRRIVSGRDPDKHVGDLASFEVYAPEEMERVDLGSRVFFMDEGDIAPPFELAP